MSNFSLLKTPEYKNITDLAMNMTFNIQHGQKGIFAYDKKSKLMFEFGCVGHAMEVDNGHFIIYGVEKSYTMDQSGNYIESKIEPEMDAIQFWETQLTEQNRTPHD